MPKDTPRDLARKRFREKGLTYDHLTKKNVQALRKLINHEMVKSGFMNDTYRCHQRAIFWGFDDLGRFWACIRCKSFYYIDREVVSFNPDGFIGFAGWSDNTNIVPILKGFNNWVDNFEMVYSE